MANDSTTLGFLTPISVLPINDRPLEDIFSVVLAGITGLPPNMVRPRFQPTVPNQPGYEENWVAFGVTVTEQDVYPYHRHVSSLESPQGATIVERDEYMDVLCSFYGSNNHEYMARWREGLAIEQNRYTMGDLGIKLVAVGKNPVSVPALFKNTWTRRVDLSCQFSRRVSVTYGIRSIASAAVELHTEELPVQTIIVNQ